jgi:DNA-binding phage protein
MKLPVLFHLNRKNLYRILSKKENPEIKSILNLLHSMGLRLTVEPKDKVMEAKVRKAA